MTADVSSRLPDIEAVEELFQAGQPAGAEAIALRFLTDRTRHAEALIALGRARHGQGDPVGAIRWADRAFRLSPLSLSTASFLGALHLAAGDPVAALKTLASFDQAELSAEALVVRCRALLATGQQDRALAAALAGLAVFPPSAVPLLGDLLDHTVRASGDPGWFAPDIGHCLRGSLPGTPLSVRLEADGHPVFDIPLAEFRQRYCTGRDRAEGNSPDRGSFRIGLLPAFSDRRLALFSDQRPLLSVDLTFPRKLRIEGDAAISDDSLSGWVWLPSLADRRLSVCVTDESGHQVTVLADNPMAVLRRVNAGDGRYGFTLSLPESGLRPGLLQVRALADGLMLDSDLLTGEPVRWTDRRSAAIAAGRLATSLVWGNGPVRNGESCREDEDIGGACGDVIAGLRLMPSSVPQTVPPRPSASIPQRPGIDVIIPVYRGRDETLACIRTVLETVGPDVRVVVIDDASPDPDLSRALATLAASRSITLLVNPQNLGFPKTVNRGLARSAGRDVVLLNSDTLVYGDWLDRLRAAAYSAPDIGTVTPLSNDGDILSYPSKSDPPPRPVIDAPSGPDHWAALHSIASRCNDGVLVEIPTAVAFCTFIRHDCLSETGDLETELFGRGYGEENDFCMRARRLGWRHMAAADVFVAHIGGHSFGRRRIPLGERNLKALNARHPGYDALVQRFFVRNPLISPRRQLDLARWNAGADQPARLIVTFGRSGGVARFVEDRLQQLRDAGDRVLLLRTADHPAAAGVAGSDRDNSDRDVPRYCRIEDPDQPDLRDLIFDTVGESDLLVDVLAGAGVASIEIQHYIDHDPMVLDLPDRLGVPYDVYIHDYSWICPQITLIDASERYCGEPALASCERCILEKLPVLDENITVEALRQRSARLLRAARTVVVPSQDVARRITRYTGPIPVLVRAWDDVPPVPWQPVAVTGRLRVGIIGAIGPHKGFDVLLACARDAARRDLPLDFVLIGFSTDDAALFATGRVFVTGPYEDEELPELIRREQLHLAFLPSVCPETWSYALSNAWSAGLRVVAFGLGTMAERMGTTGGLCLPLDLSPAIINDAFLASDLSSLSRLLSSNTGSTTMLPTAPGFPMSPTQTQKPQIGQSQIGQDQVNASAQQLAFPPGLYCVSVAGRDGQVTPTAPAAFPLPSIHITAMPGDGGSIRILGDRDGWLCQPGDALVVHISGAAPRGILLTSYQQASQSGRALEVQIARLDHQAPTGQAQAGQASLTAPRQDIRLNILTHVQNLGDVTTLNGGWAGSPEQRNWIEAFIIAPAEGLPAHAIEYKALNSSGFETPWTTGGNLCGSRGQGVPLTGMAVRLQAPYAERFDCVYQILYLSGARSPSLSNGQPHRSDRVGDPIQAFALQITERGAGAGRAAF